MNWEISEILFSDTLVIGICLSDVFTGVLCFYEMIETESITKQLKHSIEHSMVQHSNSQTAEQLAIRRVLLCSLRMGMLRHTVIYQRTKHAQLCLTVLEYSKIIFTWRYFTL